MEKSKYKKHINVSLQNKKYYDAINPILLRWANNSENMSERVSESILTATRLESSIGINKVMNTFEMIEKTLQFYFPDKNREYHNAVEKAFEKIVTVNGTMLSEFLTNPVQFSEVQPQPSDEHKEEFETTPPSSQSTEGISIKETLPENTDDNKPKESTQQNEEIVSTIVKQEVIQKEEVSPTQEKEDKKKDLEITKSEKNTIPSEKESAEEIPEEADEVVEDTKTSKDETKEAEENQEQQEEDGEISEANLGLFTL
ncbi:hypothetical protein P4T70_25040 [Bacillus mobilis]|uniref:hypothetical protein n=1 Tax=Bacillus mobilis TaxID=2026190 RepID=UPI002E212612|nr:hypothetical protein [Bacillus mobilis]